MAKAGKMMVARITLATIAKSFFGVDMVNLIIGQGLLNGYIIVPQFNLYDFFRNA